MYVSFLFSREVSNTSASVLKKDMMSFKKIVHIHLEQPLRIVPKFVL